jgi:hypothetical protein
MHLNDKHRMGYCISTATMVKETSHNATLNVCLLVLMKFIFVTMHAIRKHDHGEEVFIEDVNHNLPCNTFNTVSIHYHVRKPGTPNEQFR